MATKKELEEKIVELEAQLGNGCSCEGSCQESAGLVIPEFDPLSESGLSFEESIFITLMRIEGSSRIDEKKVDLLKEKAIMIARRFRS